MATPSGNDQSQVPDLEILSFFETDNSEEMASCSNTNTSSPTPSCSTASTSQTSSADNTENRITVDNWTMLLDDETLSYLDEIIAMDQASNKTPCPRPSTSYEEDPTFAMPRKFKCPMCPKEFNSNASMRYHGRRHILKLIKCPCGFKAQSLVQQQKHYAYHHVGVMKHKFLASF